MNATTNRSRAGRMAVLLITAMLTAACGDDGTATTNEPTDTAPVTEGETTDDGAANGSGDVGTAPPDLAATDTGVTESAIRVGAVFPNTALIGRDPGDLDAKFRTVVDAINEAGGINGRSIELTFRTADPLDDSSFDTVCVELTEDLEVFAVVGTFPRSTADCYAGLYDTVVISTFAISEERMATHTAPGITTVAHPERLLDARVDALLDAGVISEGSKIALHGSIQATEIHDLYLASLDAAGVEVVADTLSEESGDDLFALQSEMQLFTEVWESSGAEAVMSSTALGAQAILIGYNNAGIDLPILLPEGTGTAPSILRDQLGLDLAPFELATALIGDADFAVKYETGEDGVRECIDDYESATGEEVSLDESRNNLGPTVVACQVFDIFTHVAQAAGPELTTESFRNAAETAGPIDVTGLAQASLGPSKLDLDDSVGTIAVFNPDTLQFQAVS